MQGSAIVGNKCVNDVALVGNILVAAGCDDHIYGLSISVRKPVGFGSLPPMFCMPRRVCFEMR